MVVNQPITVPHLGRTGIYLGDYGAESIIVQLDGGGASRIFPRYQVVFMQERVVSPSVAAERPARKSGVAAERPARKSGSRQRGGGRARPEFEIQSAFIAWARGRGGDFAKIFAVPNEHRDAVEAMMRAAEGAQAGVPDLCCPVPRGVWHGAYFEAKAPGGSVSAAQRAMHTRLRRDGYYVEVCYSLEDLQGAAEWYLSLVDPMRPAASTPALAEGADLAGQEARMSKRARAMRQAAQTGSKLGFTEAFAGEAE